MTVKPLSAFAPTDCPHGGGAGCSECVHMCTSRPCWPTPSEAAALMDAGEGANLWLDYWSRAGDEGGDIYILGPAAVGYEGRSAPWWPSGRCTFLTEEGLCRLHRRGLKPSEGRLADCQTPPEDRDGQDLHEAVAMTWDTDEGRTVVGRWREQYNVWY